MNPHMSAEYSGPTVFMGRLFSSIAKSADIRVTAVGPQVPNILPDQISFTKLQTPELRGVSGQVVWACKSFFWLIKNYKSYEFVHFHGGYIFNLFPALAPLLLRKPYVILPLGAGGDLRTEARSNRLPFVKSIKKFILKRAQRTFALSDANASELRDWGVSRERIIHINNPASDEYFQTPTRDMNFSHDLLLVGKLGAGKRPDLVVEALNKLISDGWHDATLTLVGPFASSTFEQRMRSLVASYGLEDAVSYTGYVDDVASILKNLPSALFVLPSLQEGLPGALTEAMAMGMPVIVTDVGSMGDVVRAAGSGYVVEPDVLQISTVIDDVWSDPDHWFRLSTAAHNFACTHFSEKSVAQTYLTSLGLGELSDE